MFARLVSTSAASRTARLSSTAASRVQYPATIPLKTRWNDNDAFGHVNNAVYYVFMDDAVNTHLISHGVQGARFVAESSCRFLRPLVYPQPVEVGLSITKLGRSSATYGIGIFSLPIAHGITGPSATTERELCAAGTFVHVYVDANGRPTPMADHTRRVLEQLASSTDED